MLITQALGNHAVWTCSFCWNTVQINQGVRHGNHNNCVLQLNTLRPEQIAWHLLTDKIYFAERKFFQFKFNWRLFLSVQQCPIDSYSSMVQVIAWCHQALYPYSWSYSGTHIDIIRPQSLNVFDFDIFWNSTYNIRCWIDGIIFPLYLIVGSVLLSVAFNSAALSTCWWNRIWQIVETSVL